MKFEKAELGTDGTKLYASVFDGTSYHLFVFDSKSNLIAREDDLNVVNFMRHENYLYALCNDGKLLKFDSGVEAIEWEFETENLIDTYFAKTNVRKVNLHAIMSPMSMITVSVKDDYDYKDICTIFAENEKFLLFPLILSTNCYKIKIKGRGYVKINALERISIGGGRV